MFLSTSAAFDLGRGKDRSQDRPAGRSARPTVIGADLTVIGDLQTDGHVEIEGSVKGTINAEAVTVREGGQVEGLILAESAHVRGTVVGPIQANEVRIGKDAYVVGNVFHHALTIEPGAHVDGRRPWRPHIDRRTGATA
jgi:cytoskeletal protein CcmA (bactofilin family)